MSDTAQIIEISGYLERNISANNAIRIATVASVPILEDNEPMNTPSREEVDAKIGRASAEFNSSVIGLRKDMDVGFAGVRQEFAEVRKDMDVGFAGVREEFAVVRQDMKVGFAEIRSDMHKMHSDTTKWIIATVISLFIGFAGLFFVMSNSAKQPQQGQPIIINIPAQPAALAPAPSK